MIAVPYYNIETNTETLMRIPIVTTMYFLPPIHPPIGIADFVVFHLFRFLEIL